MVVLLLDFSRRIDTLDRLTSQLESVQADATYVMQTQEALMTQIAYATSDAAVEEWAYEDGKWVRIGENLVEIVPLGEATPTANEEIAPQTSEPPKWRIWWELFFGDQH